MWLHSPDKPALILALLIILLAILLTLCLASCSAQQAQDVEIIYVDGCALIVDGLSVQQLAEKQEDWSFGEGCEITVRTDLD